MGLDYLLNVKLSFLYFYTFFTMIEDRIAFLQLLLRREFTK